MSILDCRNTEVAHAGALLQTSGILKGATRREPPLNQGGIASLAYCTFTAPPCCSLVKGRDSHSKPISCLCEQLSNRCGTACALKVAIPSDSHLWKFEDEDAHMPWLLLETSHYRLKYKLHLYLSNAGLENENMAPKLT